jgi:hypothetical protein
MNKKAQYSPISFVFMIIFVLIVMGLIGGQVFGLFNLAAFTAHLSGLELFLYSNFAVWVFFGLIIYIFSFFARARQ